MKHNLKITFLILGMFIITQFLGLYVVDSYSSFKVVDGNIINVTSPDLPFGLETPELKDEEFNYALGSIVFAFTIAILLLFFLSKFNMAIFLKFWFFMVVTMALAISTNVLFFKLIPVVSFFSIPLPWILSLVIVLPLAFIKIYKRNFFVHNITELFIYPGVAAVFVPILNIYTVSAFLILISVYDAWAVWHSGIMQKMANYQIKKLNIFSGFFVPHVSKNIKTKLKKMKPSERKKKKIRVNVAVLGGGDVVFPIIAAGVMLKTLGLIPAVLVIIGATIGLSYLLLFSEKKKFYPAMPFISAGIFLGILVGYLVF